MDKDVELLHAEPTFREVLVSDEAVQKILEAFRAEMGDRYAGLPELQKLGGKEPVVPKGFESAEGRFFGLYDGSDLIACGGIRLAEPGVAEIKRMYVIPSRRREGHSRRVLARLEEEARLLGCDRMQLDTGVRQPEAQTLYLSEGYKQVPAPVDMPAGFVFMEKSLVDSESSVENRLGNGSLYLSPRESASIRDVIDPGQEIGRGKDSTAYELEGLQKHVLLESNTARSLAGRDGAPYVAHWDASIQRELEAFRRLAPEVGAVHTVFAWRDDTGFYRVVEKAPGKPIRTDPAPGQPYDHAGWESSIVDLANISSDHYAKLVHDVGVLREAGLYFEPGGSDNFYYHPEHGFVLIDITAAPEIRFSKNIHLGLIDWEYFRAMYASHGWQGRISPEARDGILTILDKLESGGYEPTNTVTITRKILSE